MENTTITQNWKSLIKPNKLNIKSNEDKSSTIVIAEPLEKGYALSIGNSLNAGYILLDDKFRLVTNEDSVVASVTQPMKEIEPVIATDEDETFMDEEGEPTEKDGEDKTDSKDSSTSDESEKDNSA